MASACNAEAAKKFMDPYVNVKPFPFLITQPAPAAWLLQSKAPSIIMWWCPSADDGDPGTVEPDPCVGDVERIWFCHWCVLKWLESQVCSSIANSRRRGGVELCCPQISLFRSFQMCHKMKAVRSLRWVFRDSRSQEDNHSCIVMCVAALKVKPIGDDRHRR